MMIMCFLSKKIFKFYIVLISLLRCFLSTTKTLIKNAEKTKKNQEKPRKNSVFFKNLEKKNSQHLNIQRINTKKRRDLDVKI